MYILNFNLSIEVCINLIMLIESDVIVILVDYELEMELNIRFNVDLIL